MWCAQPTRNLRREVSLALWSQNGGGRGGIGRLVGFQYIAVQRRRTIYVQRERGRIVQFERIGGDRGGQQYLHIMRTVKLGAVRVAAPARK